MMQGISGIPGVSPGVYANVLTSQYDREYALIIGDGDFRQSDFFEPMLFFLGITYNPSTFAHEIIVVEKYLSDRQHLLTDFELGIYYHLKGVLYSKQGTDSYHIVFEALNKSIEYLNATDGQASKYYLARVSDTYGQVLQTIGFYKDALVLFQESLKIKKKFKDEQSVALTHGNLGRLYFSIGNFRQAIKHLEYDLTIIRKSPGQEGLQAKMLNQIALGLIEVNDYASAKKNIDRSLAFSKIVGIESTYFSLYTLAYFYLITHEVVKSKRIITRLQQMVKKETSNYYKTVFHSRINYLHGLLSLFNGKPARANTLFRKAETPFMNDLGHSITEKARFFYYQSQALDKSGHYNESSFQLRKALSLLDQTENTTLRKEYEETLKERHKDGWLLHSAGRFIGQDQIEMILNDTGKEGFQGKSSDVAIMFSDIREFTKISEGISAGNLIELLNRYLSTMSKYIHLQSGIIDKYIGDAIMALFFSNQSSKLSVVENACVSALMMKHELIRFNRYLPAGKNKIQAGIGINFGNCVSGMIGTPQKRSLSVIGDAVNIASRIEGLTKFLGATIIVSETLYSRLPENHIFIFRPLGKFKLKGKTIPVALAELMGIDNNSKEANDQKAEIQLIEKILAQFYQGNLPEAYAGFMQLYKLTEGHSRARGYQYMADYTKNIMGTVIPKDWDGSFQLVEK